MKYLKIIFATVSLFICSGCEIKYIPPSKGPTATINFKNDGPGHLLISFFDKSSQCERRRVTPFIRSTSSASHVTHADQDVTFEYIFTTMSKECRTNLRFFPEKNHNYLFRTTYTYGYNQCVWTMEDVTQEKSQKVKLSQIPHKEGFYENGSFCREK